MAICPEFHASKTKPYYIEIPVKFSWNPVSLLHKKEEHFHTAWSLSRTFSYGVGIGNILKIHAGGGTKLSAFHLPLEIENVGTFPIENVYQAGKVFENGRPYLDLLHLSPREAKRDERLQNSGQLICFELSGRSFPYNRITCFIITCTFVD